MTSVPAFTRQAAESALGHDGARSVSRRRSVASPCRKTRAWRLIHVLDPKLFSRSPSRPIVVHEESCLRHC